MNAFTPHVRALSVWAILAVSCAIPASAQSAGTLSVKAATSKKVDLSWTGAAATFTIQRAPLGGGYSAIGTATTAAYSDTTIDAYTTYQYQIVAGSSTSNSVTVGPPPSGLTAAAPAPLVGSQPTTSYGYDLSLVLDGNGDPAFTFMWQDPNGDGNTSDTSLYFRSWNRVTYSWNPVVKIGVVDDADTYFHQTDSLAYDASTGAYAVATENYSNGSLDLYVSTDNGVTWTKKKNYVYQGEGVTSPSIAMAGGNLYLAFVRSSSGLQYITGGLSSGPSTWTAKLAPVPSGTYVADEGATISLALDSVGVPAIAYFVHDSVLSYDSVILFWRPNGSANPTRVFDSQSQQSDEVAVKLAFFGQNPRVLAYVQRLDAGFGVGDHYAQSNDGGNTWQTPVVIPPDGNSSTDYPFDMSIGSQGQIAVGFGQNGGSGDGSCPNPKLARSSNGVNFTTCSIAGADVLGKFSPYPGAIQVAFGGNDKLYYLWWATEGNSQSDTGIMMFREPPAGASTAPQLTSVTDGAAFRSSIVAGSWATVKGVNLSSQTRIWADADFNNGVFLPTNLSGVQVKVNGVLCAVYFISATQVNFQAPSNISGTVTVQVIVNNVASNTLTISAVAVSPGLFTYAAGSSTFPAAVFPASNLIVGDPAISGSIVAKAHAADVISLYATGLMATQGGVIPGSIVTVPTNVNVTLTSTTNSNITATTSASFAGLVAVGEFQINFTVPTMSPGNYNVTISVGGQTSQTGVVIPIA